MTSVLALASSVLSTPRARPKSVEECHSARRRRTATLTAGGVRRPAWKARAGRGRPPAPASTRISNTAGHASATRPPVLLLCPSRVTAIAAANAPPTRAGTGAPKSTNAAAAPARPAATGRAAAVRIRGRTAAIRTRFVWVPGDAVQPWAAPCRRGGPRSRQRRHEGCSELTRAHRSPPAAATSAMPCSAKRRSSRPAARPSIARAHRARLGANTSVTVKCGVGSGLQVLDGDHLGHPNAVARRVPSARRRRSPR